jgi:hypothetical protein
MFGHGWLRILWLHGVSLMLGWNMGLEIIAFHPNSGGTFAGTTLGDASPPAMPVNGKSSIFVQENTPVYPLDRGMPGR